jgi:hypothetical protein
LSHFLGFYKNRGRRMASPLPKIVNHFEASEICRIIFAYRELVPMPA